MKIKYLLLSFALTCFTVWSIAQEKNISPCFGDEVRQQLLLKHPELAQIETTYRLQIQEGLKHINLARLTKRTTDSSGGDNFWYDIPIVIHVIHDYGQEYAQMTDDDIYSFLTGWNIVYAKENADTSNVIYPFKGNIPNSNVRYIGNPHFRLHLATRDPYGNPTHGITRHRSYLTYGTGAYAGLDDQAKLDDWDPTSYVNIWSVNTIPGYGGFQAAAYALEPPSATVEPFSDGIICDYSYMPNSDYNATLVGKTINHEMGHIFNLYHPWGNNNGPQIALGDDDVDDTPPTWGHKPVGCDFSDPSSDDNSVYDSLFATNYFRTYGDSLVNYPDTTNTQNIMDYTYCARMFTYGQVERMHAAANNPLAGRSNLWSDSNLMFTGILNPDYTFAAWPDLKPNPDFVAWPVTGSTSAGNYMDRLNYFVLPHQAVRFQNESWGDTLTSLVWTFSNGASIPAQTVTANISGNSVTNTFTEGGWVTLTMKAAGNNTGDTIATWPNAIFVANPLATAANGYLQDFNPATSPDLSGWPLFNYYNNEFKWQINNSAGFGDTHCIEYLGYDSRVIPELGIYPNTGVPNGDVDDLFSVPFDLSGYTAGACFLNFMYSGASRSSMSLNCTDTLQIAYITAGESWITIAKLGGPAIDNMGPYSTAFTPSGPGQWTMGGIALPAAAITPYTVFRFRYLPGDGQDGQSSGNNFFMDNIHFSNWPAAVENVRQNNADITLLPNPANGDAYVIANGVSGASVQVTVTDVTGKKVYEVTSQVAGGVSRAQIPRSTIPAAGIYMIQITTGNQSVTKKLVVY